MLRPFSNPTYRKLFAAQVVALLGTGLLTVALGLLAYDLAGDQAGPVLGMAYAIKMLAYVGLAPVASALVTQLPRKWVLVGADLLRAGVALCLPFITEVWQIYLLIFLLQSASATFTPAYQATLPDVLPEEEDYTRALSLSRLAYDLENLISPMLAGLLLLVISYSGLFVGTALGFLGSALLVTWAGFVPTPSQPARPFRDRLTRGIRIYLATPRLRGLLALNLAVAASSAFVIVNTVVLVQGDYQGNAQQVALALAAYGAGSMLVALALPRWLQTHRDRPLMLGAGTALAGLLLLLALWLGLAGLPDWEVFLVFWALLGAFYAAVLTPSGRLLRRSAHTEDRPAVFAAQFALSHACWLLTYPLAGWGGAHLGMAATLAVLGGLALLGALAALWLWRGNGARPLRHSHPDLPPDHPHLLAHGGDRHAHAFVIDDEHRVWPTQG